MVDFQGQNSNEEEFTGSLYQGDQRKKTIKIILVILAAIVVSAGVLFVVLRKKTEPINIQTENTTQPDKTVADNQINPKEKTKQMEEIIAKFVDDKDRDGLSAEREKELGTSDNDSDTDGDGIPDKDEVEKWGTDPLKADTDGDGYGDGFEISGGYNPKGAGKL